MTPEDIEKLVNGIIAAENALSIDMGDGEPTYQCCNAVCGHPPDCKFGEALHVLVDNRLAYWERSSQKWRRPAPGQSTPETPK